MLTRSAAFRQPRRATTDQEAGPTTVLREYRRAIYFLIHGHAAGDAFETISRLVADDIDWLSPPRDTLISTADRCRAYLFSILFIFSITPLCRPPASTPAACTIFADIYTFFHDFYAGSSSLGVICRADAAYLMSRCTSAHYRSVSAGLCRRLPTTMRRRKAGSTRHHVEPPPRLKGRHHHAYIAPFWAVAPTPRLRGRENVASYQPRAHFDAIITICRRRATGIRAHGQREVSRHEMP